jgi:hypothetical protein
MVEAILLISRIAARKKMEAVLNNGRPQRPYRLGAGRAVIAFCVAGMGGAILTWIFVYHLTIFAAAHNYCDPTARCASWYFLLVILAFILCGISAAVLESGDSIRPKLKRRRTALIALGTVAAVVGIYLFPLLNTHPSQDACTFGTVSNGQYRQLLAEAKRRQATTWPALVWDNKKTMALLNQRVDDLSRGATSAYERLAAMHAVVRALGGDYRSTQHDNEDPYGPKNRSGIVSYSYNVDVNGLGFFSPIRRQLWLIGTLVIDPDQARRIVQDRNRFQAGNIDFIAWFPTLFDSYVIVPKSKFGESCPRLPSPALVEQMSAKP